MTDSQTPEPAAEQPSTAQNGPSPDAPVAPLATGAGTSRGGWITAAILVALIGCVASILGARSIAHSDSSKATTSFQQNSTAIASTLSIAIAHEEDLALSAGSFFAANPSATPAQFEAWAKGLRVLHRYPEVERLALVSIVHAGEITGFSARLNGLPATAAAASQAPALAVVPDTAHGFYCLSAAEVSRAAFVPPANATDFCAKGAALLLARNAGTVYYQPATGGQQKLVLFTPVYRGTTRPSSVEGRRAAFVGWLREVIIPAVVMQRALSGHPANQIRLTRSAGAATVSYAVGTPVAGAQSSTSAVRGGWRLQSFGPAPGPGVFGDGDALALLITGLLLSALAGVLVYVLGVRRGPREVDAAVAAPDPKDDLYDRLTGLPNRALMLDRADRMLARAARQSGMLVGALFVDIDWFKDITDRLGEDAGDQMIKIVAERLEGVIRSHDTVGRLGGDEFVVLVESSARGARLDSLARRIIDALHKPVDVEGFGPSVALTASIGVAFGRYTSPDDLLRDARTALIAAKAAGKDRYTVFNANMRSVVEGRGTLEAELNDALGAGQFFLLYEPVRDITSGRVVGLEADIRWRHPSQGVLAPADFMPLAEETGLIVPIGRWMLEEACARSAALSVLGTRVSISVRVSANQLNRDGFITDVRRALMQSGIEPSLLVLEVAETTVMRDIGSSAERLLEIKGLGVRVAIDDFGGSGYAYHSDLRRLPLDFLKVDRSSLAASDDEDYRSWLLEAILIVGRDLSLTVIATGISSAEQVEALAGMGCSMAQGPFIGGPVPSESLSSLVESALPEAPAASPGVGA